MIWEGREGREGREVKPSEAGTGNETGTGAGELMRLVIVVIVGN